MNYSARFRLPSFLSIILVLGFSIFGLVTTSTSVLAATNNDWPRYLHDQTNSAASQDTNLTTGNVSQLVKKWTFPTGGTIAASPTVAGGVVYIGSWDGYMYALDAATGAQKWKTFLGITTGNQGKCYPQQAGVSSSATVQNGVVYVGGGDSYWYALNASSGQVLWKVFTGDNSAASGHYNWSSPLLYNGFAYVGVASLGDCPLVQGELLKINLTTHAIDQTLKLVPDGQVGAGVWLSPLVDAATNTVYFTTGTENLTTQAYAQAIVAVDANTLAIKDSWRISEAEAVLDSDFATSPILLTDSNGRKLISAINKNGIVYTFDRANLKAGPIWKHQIAVGGECAPCGVSTVSSGAFGHGYLFQAGGETTIQDKGAIGSVRALNPADGTSVWEHPTNGPVVPALAYVNGMVVAGPGSVLEVLDATNGHSLFSYDTGSSLYAAPSIARGVIYTGNVAGQVIAFGLPAKPAPTPAPDPACPAGSTCQDIGAPNPAGSETVANGTWTVKVGGSGVAGATDSFRLMTQPANGDTQVSAQATSQQPAGTPAQAGVMLRQGNDPGSPYYAALFVPNQGLVVQYRQVFGANPVQLSATTMALPRYIDIQRQGNQLQAATSTDGTNYTLVPGTTVAVVMPYQLLGGLAVSSRAQGTLTTATIANLRVGSITNTAAAAPSAHACPANWSCQDIGNPSLVGDQTLTNGSWSIQGSGNDIWMYGDQFHYVWQPLTGDGGISARVVSQTNTSPSAKAGVMLRQSTDAASPYYAAYLTPNGVFVEYRDHNGYLSSQATNTTGTAPVYLKVARSTTTATTYTSADGTTWTPLAGSSVSLPDLSGTILSGMAVTSHNGGALSTVAFDTVTSYTTAPTPPTQCPTNWACEDIGFPTPAGDQTLNNGAWSIRGGGGDIWDTYDSFRFIHQNLTADGTVTAKITSQDNTSDWAKAGLMLRLTNDPGSPYYAVFVTPSHGVVVQYRTTQAGTSNQVAQTAGTIPRWLQVSRVGTTYTASMSTDGTTWTPLANSSVTLANVSGTLLAGMAVTSHNTAALSAVGYSNVALTVTGGPLPTGWNHQDIGAPAIAGSASFLNNVFTVYGAGNDIWAQTDQFHYAYQALNGDGTLTARVTSQTNTDPWAKAGVMIKESATAMASYVMAAVTPGNGRHMQYNFNGDVTGPAYTFPNAWVRIKRAGNTFTTYTSNDGTTWTQMGTTTITMNTTATVGLFVTSHNGQQLSKVTFDNVSLTTP